MLIQQRLLLVEMNLLYEALVLIADLST